MLEAGWQKLLGSGFKPWPNDLNPSSYRFASCCVEASIVEVALDPCLSYRDRIGGRQSEFVEKFPKSFQPTPLAVTTVITSHDRSGEERVLITLRDEK